IVQPINAQLVLATAIQSLAVVGAPPLVLVAPSELPLHVAQPPPYPSAVGSPIDALHTLHAFLKLLANQLEWVHRPFRSARPVELVIRSAHESIVLGLNVGNETTLDDELVVSALRAAPL